MEKLPLGVKLMPHQRAMLYKMILMENEVVGTNNAYAMMSDKPGAGKTYAILSMIYFMDKVLFKRKHVTLIVVPYNICTQWLQSMEKIYGNRVSYKTVTDYSHIMSLYTKPEELLQYDILLTTSLYFHNIASTLESLKITLRRVFFDEADTIKNLLQTPLKCKMTWFVSASMESLFDKGSNVKIGSYSLSLEHLKKYDIACETEFVNSHIILDKPMVHTIECKNVYYNLLQDLVVNREYHERMSAFDYNFLKTEYLSHSENIKNEYEACLYIYKEATLCRKECISEKDILEVEYKRLIQRELLDAANTVSEKIQNFERIIQDCDRKLSIIRYFSSKYDIDEIFECKGVPYESKIEKIYETLLHITSQNNRAQCILFTNFDRVYSMISRFLDIHGISYKYLDGGNIRSMDTIIDAYKRRGFTILLADSSMYSCGMNLENTSDILFIHEMDPHKEKQVIGRAQRYGRDGVLNVWYFRYSPKK